MSSAASPIISSKVEVVPNDCFAPLNPGALYPSDNPLEVDLGCGDGAFLAAIAAKNPDRNFLGIERLVGRVRAGCRKIERAGLTNARILRFEISYAVEHLLPASCVTTFHIMFPDPWPKRRHAPRRLITAKFLGSLQRALQPGGTVRIATDELDYFRQIVRVAEESTGFAIAENAAPLEAVSKFEMRFRNLGTAIHRIALRKVCPPT